MRFRDDIDLETTYVVSDTHFGHDNIVNFCHRPEDHEHVMMERWAQAVPEGATVIHLGDLAYKGARKFEKLIAPHLTGARKLLILGNHDTSRLSLYRAAGFRVAKPFMLPIRFVDGRVVIASEVSRGDSVGDVLAYDPQRADIPWVVSFSHYPWGEARDAPESESAPIPADQIRVHGHIHNNGYFREGFVPFVRNHINISVEQTKYRPVNLANLLSGYLLGTVQVTADDVQKGIAQTHSKREA
jgi:calcineurin-like phosphoesterase family protein